MRHRSMKCACAPARSFSSKAGPPGPHLRTNACACIKPPRYPTPAPPSPGVHRSTRIAVRPAPPDASIEQRRVACRHRHAGQTCRRSRPPVRQVPGSAPDKVMRPVGGESASRFVNAHGIAGCSRTRRAIADIISTQAMRQTATCRLPRPASPLRRYRLRAVELDQGRAVAEQDQPRSSSTISLTDLPRRPAPRGRRRACRHPMSLHHAPAGVTRPRAAGRHADDTRDRLVVRRDFNHLTGACPGRRSATSPTSVRAWQFAYGPQYWLTRRQIEAYFSRILANKRPS